MRVLWATAAVVAIFAMHGLATHGAAHPTGVTTPDATTVAAVGAVGAAGHGLHGTVAHDSPTSAGATPREHPGEVSVLGLCLAVLATAAIALLRLVRPRSGLLAVLPRLTSVGPPAGGSSRGPGPPDLHALSILRC